MTKDSFIEFLCKENINFEVHMVNGTPLIYVKGKTEWIDGIFDNNKLEYTPYLRFSHFDEKPGMMYVRDNGLCDYQTDEWCKAECIKYRDNFKED